MQNKKEQVYFIPNPSEIGVMEFTFDGKKVFNLFRDYPNKLTVEQKRIFDETFPFWKEFFKDRTYIPKRGVYSK